MWNQVGETIQRTLWGRGLCAVMAAAGLSVMVVGVWVVPAGAAPVAKEDSHAGLTQNWDKVLPSAERFLVLAGFGGAAVLDKETGLVWQRTPDSSLQTRNQARGGCLRATTGGRMGWRLPAIEELASLIDPAAVTGEKLSAGHPFTGISNEHFYWATTASVQYPDDGWGVNFGFGVVGDGTATFIRPAWCVRGGHNAGSEY